MAEVPEFIELRLDQVVACLVDYLRLAAEVSVEVEFEDNAEAAIRELRKVILYRGNVLWIQERVKRHREYYLAVGRGKPAPEGLNP